MTAAPEGVVERAYELSSFAAGGSPDRDAFRMLVTRPAVLARRVSRVDERVRVMDLDRSVPLP